MIDVVVCYSILEKCKSIDAFSSDTELVKMVIRLRQHRMVVSELLMEHYEEYFQKKSPEWLEWYRNYCTDIFYTKERAAIRKPRSQKTYIKENKYLNELTALCMETADKIMLIEPKRKMDMAYAKSLGISLFDSTDISDASGNNLFSMYTLPVNGKSIPEGENSRTIAKWLGRFLQEENYIQIFDSYLLTKDGIKYLKNYFLKYIKEQASIELYSLLGTDYTKQQIAAIFAGKDFEKWNFSIYLMNSKKDLHARSIQGAKYIIQIDRGLSVFGKYGKTFQTTVSIFENKGVPRALLTETQLEQII